MDSVLTERWMGLHTRSIKAQFSSVGWLIE